MNILLIVYDNGGHINYFPTGTAYIASVLEQAGHNVYIYQQDVHHYPPEHLTNYLNNNQFDIIGLGFIAGYWQYKKVIEIANAIRQSNSRSLFILGGHGPTPEPEYFINKLNADIVVMGEGEETILDLLESGIDKVDGITWCSSDKIITNSDRKPIQDIDCLPFPAYHLFPIEYYRLRPAPNSEITDFVMPIITSRGCSYHCNFCYNMTKQVRLRKIKAIIDEIKLLQENYRINYIQFNDDLLMYNEERTIEISEAIIKANLNIKWYCNGRLNYATKEVLEVMKRSGCVFINYGIEAFDDEVLKNMNKHLTCEQIVHGIETTLKIGISPGFNIIWGNIGDNLNTLMKGKNFLLKYDDGIQLRNIRPMTPYPGSELYYYAIKKGLLKDCENFYEKKHINSDLLSVNFTNLSDDYFHRALLLINKDLVRNYYQKQTEKAIDELTELYIKKNVNFRGFRHL